MTSEPIKVLHELLPRLAEGASRRDAERILPHEEIRLLSEAGLYALTVPATLGGPDVSVATLTEVFRLLSVADPSIGQIPQSHYVFLEALRLRGTADQQRRFYGEVLAAPGTPMPRPNAAGAPSPKTPPPSSSIRPQPTTSSTARSSTPPARSSPTGCWCAPSCPSRGPTALPTRPLPSCRPMR